MNLSVRPHWQFSIHYTSYKGYGAVTPLWRAILRYHWSYYWNYKWRLDRTTNIWITNHGYLDYEPRIFGLRYPCFYRHRRITTPKDCLKDRIFAISGLLYIKKISRTDTPGLYKPTSRQWYIWIICEILLDYVWKHLTIRHLLVILDINR